MSLFRLPNEAHELSCSRFKISVANSSLSIRDWGHQNPGKETKSMANSALNTLRLVIFALDQDRDGLHRWWRMLLLVRRVSKS